MEPACILIVEDESIVALDVQNILESLGYTVCATASTGEEAMRLALDLQPDLILMDIRLAGDMDGIETAERIRAQLDVPIIFVTAYADRDTLDRAKVTRPFGYITKPLDIRELHTTIEISLYRHRLERRERENAYRIEQVFNTVAHGLVLLDENSVVEIANQRALDYLTLLTGQTITIGERLRDINEHPVTNYLATEADAPPHQTHEITIQAPEERVFVLESIRLVHAPGNPARASTSGWVMTLQDVTAARQQERYLKQQERLAAVGQLAAGIAHDFGNILSTISLASDILPRLEPQLSTRSMEHLQRVRQQVRRASDLIAQILDFSRSSFLEKATLDLVPLLKEWTKLLSQTLPENIQLHLEYPEAPCTVNADPTRMQQVLWNLVINARDALPQGGNIMITLDRLTIDEETPKPFPDLTPGEWVRLTVTDDGVGIAADALPYIFEPFFTTKEPDRGTGLGLAQVYGIVKQHDGLIDVSSVPGKGTTFTVFWPLAQQLPLASPADEAIPLRPLHQGHGERLLVVEDNPDARTALADSLRALDYTIIEAANGHEALTVLQNTEIPIRLVVTDNIMPRMGAVELCQALQDAGIHVPVIVVSGYARDEDIATLKQLGVIDYIRKPARLEHLSQLIAQTLSESDCHGDLEE